MVGVHLLSLISHLFYNQDTKSLVTEPENSTPIIAKLTNGCDPEPVPSILHPHNRFLKEDSSNIIFLSSKRSLSKMFPPTKILYELHIFPL
jgi:hypothetical protein